MPIRSESLPDANIDSVKSEVFAMLGLADTLPGVFSGEWFGSGPYLEKRSPIDGTFLARIAQATSEDYERAVGGAQRAFAGWRTTPAPIRFSSAKRTSSRSLCSRRLECTRC